MSTPTQTRHPWRATVRTIVAVAVAMAALLPLIVAASGVDETVPVVAVVLAVAGAITRVMALPQVDEFLARFVPWLAAAPEDTSTDPLTYAYAEPPLPEQLHVDVAVDPRRVSCSATDCADPECLVHNLDHPDRPRPAQ